MRKGLQELVRFPRERRPLSVRARATAITVGASALILTVLFVLVLLLARDWTFNRVQSTSQRTIERITADIAAGREESILVPRRGETGLVQFLDARGEVVAARDPLKGRPPLVGRKTREDSIFIDERACPSALDECAWIFGLRLRESPWGEGVTVVAATPLPGMLTMGGLALGITVLAAGLLALITWWTWHTIGRVFIPVDQINAEMAAFSAEGLHHRVAVPQTGNAIRVLAENVNRTLERLEEARDRERRFVSDASHDLRNPLAGLQTRLEVLLEEPDDTDWKPMVRSALRDAERLNAILVDLLELSRLDSRAPSTVESIDLAALVRREVGRRVPRAPIETRLQEGVTVRANRVRLARILNNLLNNAERHTRSRVRVTVAARDGETTLEVLDDGPGVPEHEREQIFERFSRLPESRELDPDGTGLGLPIAREIAEYYGGSLRVEDSPRGARFVLRLPCEAAG